MRKLFLSIVILVLALVSLQCKCGPKPTMSKSLEKSPITEAMVRKVTDSLIKTYGNTSADRIKRGVKQTASLWRIADGSNEAFEKFCSDNFIGSDSDRQLMFKKISQYMESLFGHFHDIIIAFQWNMDVPGDRIQSIDPLFAGYDVYAHYKDDFFRNKIAFITVLNFPFYSLEEKTQLGANWTRQEWANARLGDYYTARVPALLTQQASETRKTSDGYISGYNLYVGYLLNKKGETMFPKEKRLLSHWNLRDELKSNYNSPDGLDKQLLIYEAMKRIVSQEIPIEMIDNNQFQWNPYTNKLFKDGKEIAFTPETDKRYEMLLNNFKAESAMDVYYPEAMNTFIKRKFSGEMEIPQQEVEALFIKLVSSPVVKKVANLIKTRLGRELQPFDIWYNGFQPRSSQSEAELDKITKAKYPDAKALEKDLPNILKHLGFSEKKIDFIASLTQVDPARGSGHAWGPEMKNAKANLRTRVGEGGIDYKGFNIAVHEFGHNVEQLITMNDVDYYMMQGVPNTAFTEALAYAFQERDLEFLNIENKNPDKHHMMALDTFWSVYEIMGVSLVDMGVWNWLYDNPNATAIQLKEAVIRISKEVWNKYYAPVFNVQDETILGVYSHMISYPLYLSAYSYGHLIYFQFEQYVKDKDFAEETERMFSMGRLVPQLWMKKAMGNEIAIEPLLEAVKDALTIIK